MSCGFAIATLNKPEAIITSDNSAYMWTTLTLVFFTTQDLATFLQPPSLILLKTTVLIYKIPRRKAEVLRKSILISTS